MRNYVFIYDYINHYYFYLESYAYSSLVFAPAQVERKWVFICHLRLVFRHDLTLNPFLYFLIDVVCFEAVSPNGYLLSFSVPVLYPILY